MVAAVPLLKKLRRRREVHTPAIGTKAGKTRCRITESDHSRNKRSCGWIVRMPSRTAVAALPSGIGDTNGSLPAVTKKCWPDAGSWGSAAGLNMTRRRVPRRFARDAFPKQRWTLLQRALYAVVRENIHPTEGRCGHHTPATAAYRPPASG